MLSDCVPGTVTVTPQADGALIVIETGGTSHDFSIGDGPSAIVRQLLAGRVR